MAEDIAISERTDVALASLIARRDRLETLRMAVRDGWRAHLPLTPRIVQGDGASFVWGGPLRWLVAAQNREPHKLVASLRTHLNGFAAVCDQSDGIVILRVSGRLAREVLAKGVPVDLHPSVFSPSSAAVTVAAQIRCHMWQVDHVPTYEFAIPTSFMASFRHWLAGATKGFKKAARHDEDIL